MLEQESTKYAKLHHFDVITLTSSKGLKPGTQNKCFGPILSVCWQRL